MIGNETDEITEELFNFFFWNICGFVLDSVDLLYFKFHGISLDRDGLYIDTPKWLKNKKVTKNPKTNDDKCLQYAVTLALNYRIIEKIYKKYQKLICLLINMIRKK